MQPVKTILCPTDFSPCSDAAIGLAVELAKELGASIHLVHIFQLPFYVGWEDGPATVAATGEFLDELRQRSGEKLEEAAERCRQAGVQVTTEQADGVPHARVLELGDKADMIVMGTHGRTGLPRLVLGSVAERIVRLAKCPVLTVPSADEAEA
ncbi:MAG: universal stress protein [Myxococcales bacterium]|nr:universal stress protein [Myxococcales bacterium]